MSEVSEWVSEVGEWVSGWVGEVKNNWSVIAINIRFTKKILQMCPWIQRFTSKWRITRFKCENLKCAIRMPIECNNVTLTETNERQYIE